MPTFIATKWLQTNHRTHLSLPEPLDQWETRLSRPGLLSSSGLLSSTGTAVSLNSNSGSNQGSQYINVCKSLDSLGRGVKSCVLYVCTLYMFQQQTLTVDRAPWCSTPTFIVPKWLQTNHRMHLSPPETLNQWESCLAGLGHRWFVTICGGGGGGSYKVGMLRHGAQSTVRVRCGNMYNTHIRIIPPAFLVAAAAFLAALAQRSL